MDRGYDVVSKGTDDHLFLVSFIGQGLTGKDVDAWLGAANVTVNKNAVPNDPQSPFVTSGIRVGTPAVTTRGFARRTCSALRAGCATSSTRAANQGAIDAVKSKVLDLCRRFPVYAG